MKKKILLSIIIPLVFASLSGCTAKEKYRLTFGTQIQQDLTTVKELTTAQLLDKAKNEKEVFLLATYQGSYSQDCLCWATFQNVIVSYMNRSHEIVYTYDTQTIDDTVANLKIEQYEDSTPALYIFAGEKKIASFSYKNSKDKGIFEDPKGITMKQRVHAFVERPLLYYIYPEEVQHNQVKYHSSMVVLFMRRGCGDCSYVIPNVIIPYISSHKLQIGIRIVDLQDLYDLSKSETATEEEKAEYQNTKDLYKLSETTSEEYGYLNGVVPTLQFYNQGSLADSTVFFNDEIAKKEDGTYYVSNSFYTKERLTSIKYADNVKNNVLKDMVLNEEDVITTASGYSFWAQEKAAQYHTPLLTAFLDAYCR